MSGHCLFPAPKPRCPYRSGFKPFKNVATAFLSQRSLKFKRKIGLAAPFEAFWAPAPYYLFVFIEVFALDGTGEPLLLHLIDIIVYY